MNDDTSNPRDPREGSTLTPEIKHGPNTHARVRVEPDEPVCSPDELKELLALASTGDNTPTKRTIRRLIKTLNVVEDLNAEVVKFERESHAAAIDNLVNLVCQECGSFPASAPTTEDTIKRAVADGKAKAVAAAVAVAVAAERERFVEFLKRADADVVLEAIENGEF